MIALIALSALLAVTTAQYPFNQGFSQPQQSYQQQAPQQSYNPQQYQPQPQSYQQQAPAYQQQAPAYQPQAPAYQAPAQPQQSRAYQPAAVHYVNIGKDLAGDYKFGYDTGKGPKDVSVKGLEAIKKCKRVYLEAYTSLLTVGKEILEQYYEKDLIIADREMVEQDSDSILEDAAVDDIAFLVVGDPFGATTHSDMVLRAIQKEIPYKVIHNASILNAVGCCGLQLYRFGEVVSIVFWTADWKPESFYDKITSNRKSGLHTLCLLDLKIKEQSVENLIKGKKIYEPPRFMTVSCASQQLLEIIYNKKGSDGENLAYTEDTICIGLARIGSDDQKIIVGSLRKMSLFDLGKPLHSLIICGDLHPVEIEMLKIFAEDKEWFDEATKCFRT